MTNPIQRAAEPAHNAYMHLAATGDHHVVWPGIAHAVFESIDVDGLARALHARECAPNCPRDVGDTDKRYARAMKAHLTGKGD